MLVLFFVGFLVSIFSSLQCFNDLNHQKAVLQQKINPKVVLRLEGKNCAKSFFKKTKSLESRLPKMSRRDFLAAYPYTLFLYAQVQAFLDMGEEVCVNYTAFVSGKFNKEAWKKEYNNFRDGFGLLGRRLEALCLTMKKYFKSSFGGALRSSVVVESQVFKHYSELATNILNGLKAVLHEYKNSNKINRSIIGLDLAKAAFVLGWINLCGEALFDSNVGVVALRLKEHRDWFSNFQQDIEVVFGEYKKVCLV